MVNYDIDDVRESLTYISYFLVREWAYLIIQNTDTRNRMGPEITTSLEIKMVIYHRGPLNFM